MHKFISKSGLYRTCLFFFILFCSVVTCENAFSGRQWKYQDMEVLCNQKKEYITFKFLIFDIDNALSHIQSYMSDCDLSYSKDGIKYTDLISLSTVLKEFGEDKAVVWTEIQETNNLRIFEFCKSYKPSTSKQQPGAPLVVATKMTETKRNEGGYSVKSKTAYMVIKWNVPKSCNCIHSFKLSADWVIKDRHSQHHPIIQIYPVSFVK